MWEIENINKLADTKNRFEIFEAVSTELAAVRQGGRRKGTWDEASSPSRPQDGRWDGEGPKSAVGPGASPAPAMRDFAREQRAAPETALSGEYRKCWHSIHPNVRTYNLCSLAYPKKIFGQKKIFSIQ